MKSQNKSKNLNITQVRLIVFSIICLFLLTIAKQCNANQATWEKLAPIREQYQKIKTLHIKSSMTVESEFIGSPNSTLLLIDYEHWEDDNGRYKTVYSFTDANGPVKGSDWEYAYDGQRFYMFERQSKTASYGEIEPNRFPLTPENPLFAPLLFLKDNSNESNMCPLKLKDILNMNKWQMSLKKSEDVKVTDSPQKAIKISDRIIDGVKFNSYLYFDAEGHIEKIKSAGMDANPQSLLISINEYQTIVVDGKKTYWPKIIQLSGTDPADKTVVKLTAQIDLLEINTTLPDKIFTVDMASAKSVWNEDIKTFVK